jgi:hypothetical protein
MKTARFLIPVLIRSGLPLGAGLLAAALLAGGCLQDHPSLTGPQENPPGLTPGDEQRSEIVSPPPPAEVATVQFGSETLRLWGYTGSSLADSPSDPVNAVFLGQSRPLQIRSALLALDGNRTAYGLPDAYPFNATWSEAIGDVQTNWSDGDGWSANYVQLQLGSYDPIRFHLRLFQTGRESGDGVWTVGAIHMDLLIPGTADHQVISWETAEAILQVDMLRSGLLDPAMPMIPTGPINSAPSFRSIPAPIYNGLPRDLQILALGPNAPDQADADVPIPSDGQGTIFHLVAAAPPVIGATTQSFVLNYQIVMPKPFCNDGSRSVLVTGPVGFEKTAVAGGAQDAPYRSRSQYRGTLTITPWDITLNQPAGDPYNAEVSGSSIGDLLGNTYMVIAADNRIAHPHGGLEYLRTNLRVHSAGSKSYLLRSRCDE